MSNKKIIVSNFPDTITPVLSQSCCIYSLQRQVCLWIKLLPEIMSWFEQRLSERENVDMEDGDGNYILLIIDLSKYINMVLESYYDGISSLQSQVDKYDFSQYMYKNILHNDDDKDHLPIPVLSNINPTMNTSFMLHVIFSIGIFDT